MERLIFILLLFISPVLTTFAQNGKEIKKNQTDISIVKNSKELVNFKNALISLTKKRVEDVQGQDQMNSLFDEKYQTIISESANALLIKAGYKDTEIKKLKYSALLREALRVYAEHTKY